MRRSIEEKKSAQKTRQHQVWGGLVPMEIFVAFQWGMVVLERA